MSTISNTTRPKAQATEVAYELHTLGGKAFQNLCVTITGEVWGQTGQSFFDSHDGGRDGAFHGMWKPKDGESFEGSFTAQCKFTAKADKQLQLSDLKDELSKAKCLAARGLSDNYFLFTNARLTGVAEATIREASLALPLKTTPPFPERRHDAHSIWQAVHAPSILHSNHPAALSRAH